MKIQPVPTSKSRLAIILSKLAVFDKSRLKIMKEQYATDSEAAAGAMWFAYMNGDIEEKVVSDFGCGTGLLGIAALLLGAGKVCFVDSDKDAIEICSRNIAASVGKEAAAKTMLIASDVAGFSQKADTIIQNPPFGTKVKHTDREFLLAAFMAADTVYSMHKIETADFVKKLAEDNGFTVTNILPLQLQLKNTYGFHHSKMRRIEVGWFRIVKK